MEACKDPEVENFILTDPTEYHDQYLSWYDLAHFPGFLSAWACEDTAVIEEALEYMGADMEYGYAMTICDHRSRIEQKLCLSTPRFTFREKTTKEWIKTGMAVEDVIRSVSDKEFQDDLKQMSKRYNLGTVLDGAAAKAKKKVKGKEV